MNAPLQMAESEFHERVERVLAAIEGALDGIEADVDAELNGGILSITFDNGSKVIVNRQTPNREIWVAARSGGFHFRLHDGVWSDTRSGESLEKLLTRVISEQAGSVIGITL